MVFKQVIDVVENQMHLVVNIVEETKWNHPNLSYAALNVSKFLKSNRIDISYYKDDIWKPNIIYTETNSVQNLSEIVFLYPNGDIIYQKELVLSLTCQFDYTNIPSDRHSCYTVGFVVNEFSDTAILIPSSNIDQTNLTYLTWNIQLQLPEMVDVRWQTEPSGYSSGIKMTFNFQREKNFLMKYFVGPSIILVILSYSTFFLSSGN